MILEWCHALALYIIAGLGWLILLVMITGNWPINGGKKK